MRMAAPVSPPLPDDGVTRRTLNFALWLERLGLGALFALSPFLLERFGWNYGAAGGSLVDKIHPGTFLLVAGLLLRVLLHRRPVTYVWQIISAHGGLILYLFTLAILFLQAMLVQKVPFTPLIDTFVTPVLVFLLLRREPGAPAAPDHEALTRALHVFMAANALVGLGEYVTGLRVTPYTIAGTELSEDWRSTAFLGHPLANAAISGIYIQCLAAGADGIGRLRLLAIVLQLAGMVAFGGRVATVLTVLVLLGHVGLGAWRVARGAPVPLRAVTGAMVVAPIVLVLLGGLYFAGAFDRFLERFVSDEGSASARLAMFALFDGFPLLDILIGPDPAKLATLTQVEGLEYGIESFQVAMVLSYGAVAAGLFFIGLALFSFEVLAFCRLAALVPLLMFYLIASTSVSLSAKTVLLGIIVALLMLLLPAVPRRHR